MKSLKKLFVIVDTCTSSSDFFTDFIAEDKKFLERKCKKMNKLFSQFINIGSKGDRYKILPFVEAVEFFAEKVTEANIPDYSF